MRAVSGMAGEVGVLMRLGRRRLWARLRHPQPAEWLAVAVPLALLAGVLLVAGPGPLPDPDTAEGGATLGLLLGAPLAALGYGVLFRAPDDGLLRRLGVHPRAVFAQRVLRLLLISLLLVLLAALPFAAAGHGALAVLVTGGAAAVAAWAVGVASQVRAARAMAAHHPGDAWGLLSLGMWDRELASAAPLVWAPLPPLLAGAVAGGVVGGAAGAGGARAGVIVALAAALVLGTARAWEQALPRFAPQATEMTFAPPPSAGAGELRAGQGVARLLPRPAAAVWARDAAVAGRRFGWASRIVWPVVAVSWLALARWGDDPATRRWVAATAVAVWLLQAAAMVALGRVERAGPRWVDRLSGVTRLQRLLGRWGWGWGMGIWLAVPLALAWSWWSGAGPGWPWLLASGATAAVGALASLAAAGWR